MFKVFEKNSNLFALVSEKSDGSMKIFSDHSRDFLSMENRKKFFAENNIKIENVSSALLCHGNGIAKITSENKGKFLEGIDGLLTKEKGIFLSITVADCLPIFLFDSKKETIALVHAGWRGLQKGIIAEMIGALRFEGSLPENIFVAIGPAIGSCHFEVGKDVAQEFSRFGDEVKREEKGKTFLNLKRIAQLQLIENGILNENIEVHKDCTYCEKDKYFSYRRDAKGDLRKLEAMVAVFGMKSE